MIKIRGLQKLIGSATALDISKLEVLPGEVAALVGPASSGKKALLEIMIGRSRPSAGEVRIGGVDPLVEKDAFSRNVGVLFEEDSIYSYFTPLANLEFYCRFFGLPKSRALEVLTQVGMGDQAGARVDKLPSGLLRRLAFARAILHNPDVLLLFEPFARCDEISIDLLNRLMRDLAAQEKAILIFQNDESYLETICETIYYLNQGRITQSRHPEDDRQSGLPFKIPARVDEKVVLFNPVEILFAEAAGGRAILVTRESRLPAQFTLSELEERLSRSGFFRAHRSYLVNLQHVKEVIPFTRNSFSLRLNDVEGTLIPLSKSAASELKDLLGY